MNDKVRRFTEENRLLEKGDSVIAALSGGADSVCLLSVLISLKEYYQLEIYAAHFNHGIRGEEADRDEAFTVSLCERSGIPLFRGRADVPSAALESGESVELCARRLRYEWLSGLSRELSGAKIATAHHLGDNAETVLWNLIRGSGLKGLGGIPARRGEIIRPLLSCSRAEIEEYCALNGLSYVTDSTNLDDGYTRNKLRHKVIPVLTELNPGAVENIARTSGLMREADAYLDKISLSELKSVETSYGYSCEKLLKLDAVILKYALKNLLELSGAPVDHRHISLVIEAMRGGGAVELGGGFTASCAQGILRIVSCEETSPDDLCEPAMDYMLAHGTRFRIKNGAVECTDRADMFTDIDSKKINNLLLKHGIRCDIITSDAAARRRRAGDTFTDARRGITKPLRKLMNELKIPRELRDRLTVIAEGSVILWLQGYGTSAQAKADMTLDGDIILMDSMGDK